MIGNLNNGYGYSAYTPQSYQNRMGLDWVNGIDGAKAYQLITGGPMLLLDSGDPTRFYIKANDNLGMPQPIRIFKYEEITQEFIPPQESTPKTDNYVTKEDFDRLEKMISDLKKNKDYKDKK